MLLITVRTGKGWAWVLKSENQDRAIAAGFGHRSRQDARAAGVAFVEMSKEG